MGEFFHHSRDGDIAAPQISGVLSGSGNSIFIDYLSCPSATNGGLPSCEESYEFVLVLTR
jgi:hypothetical protein